MNVSPLERLLLLAVKSTVSAPSRRAARLKLVLVRVEFSKNRLATANLQQLDSPSAILGPLTKFISEVKNSAQLFGTECLQSEQMPLTPGTSHW